MTKMRDSFTAAAAAPTAISRGARKFEMAYAGQGAQVEITVPVTNDRAWLRIIGSFQEIEVAAEVEQHMAERKLDRTPFTGEQWEKAYLAFTLARAVREGEAITSPPYGSPEDWGQLDIQDLYKVMRQYADMRANIDPELEELTEEEVEQIWEAAEKKSGTFLRSCGVKNLAAFILTLESRPASSHRPSSKPGAPSSDG